MKLTKNNTKSLTTSDIQKIAGEYNVSISSIKSAVSKIRNGHIREYTPGCKTRIKERPWCKIWEIIPENWIDYSRIRKIAMALCRDSLYPGSVQEIEDFMLDWFFSRTKIQLEKFTHKHGLFLYCILDTKKYIARRTCENLMEEIR